MADPTPSVILKMIHNVANIHPELICGEDMNLQNKKLIECLIPVLY